MYGLLVLEALWCLILNIERHKNLEVFVTACSNSSCVEYGVPLNVPDYIKNKFPNGMPCDKCKKAVLPKRSLASVRCRPCRRYKNYLDEHSFFKELSNETDIVCDLCGGKEIDLKIFCELKKTNIIVEEKIEETKHITEKEPQNHTELPIPPEKIDRKLIAEYQTKSGISLPRIPTKKVMSNPETKGPKNKGTRYEAVKKTPITKHTKSAENNPKSVKKSTVSTNSTPNYPWRDKRRSGGVIKTNDEFEHQHRKCATCGAMIAMSTLQSRPDTKYCIDHIEHAGRMVPVNDGIMSREGAKQMRGKDRSLAQQSKKVL